MPILRWDAGGLVIQGDRKVTQPIPDTCSIEIRKQKTMLY
jgi:hypothetical protein